MADTLKPMSDDDITPNASGDLKAEAPLKNGGGEKLDAAKQAIKDNAGKYASQAGDKARALADEGKAKAHGALDQLAQMLTDAAGTVDEKLGERYGTYARSAAEGVAGFSDNLKGKSVDDLVEDVRDFVRKSPAVAIGMAAAVGFVLARLIGAGFDQRDKD